MSWNLNLNWNRFSLQEAEVEWHKVEFTEFQFKEMNGILDFFPYPDSSVCEAFKTFKKILLQPLGLYEFYWISLFNFPLF